MSENLGSSEQIFFPIETYEFFEKSYSCEFIVSKCVYSKKRKISFFNLLNGTIRNEWIFKLWENWKKKSRAKVRYKIISNGCRLCQVGSFIHTVCSLFLSSNKLHLVSTNFVSRIDTLYHQHLKFKENKKNSSNDNDFLRKMLKVWKQIFNNLEFFNRFSLRCNSSRFFIFTMHNFMIHEFLIDLLQTIRTKLYTKYLNKNKYN